MLRTIIVDDERLARQKIRTMLARETDVEILGESANGSDALELIRRERPDLVFLDVQMPGLDGFAVARALGPEITATIIFVTAHEQYAVRAFEVHALDYLLKPFDRSRFRMALERARHQFQSGDHVACARRIEAMIRELKPGHLERITVRANGRVFFVRTEEVDWIEAADNYVKVYAGSARYRVRQTIKSLESQLDPAQFARSHRSAIVKLDRVRSLDPMAAGEYLLTLSTGAKVALSRGYRDSFRKQLEGRA